MLLKLKGDVCKYGGNLISIAHHHSLYCYVDRAIGLPCRLVESIWFVQIVETCTLDHIKVASFIRFLMI